MSQLGIDKQIFDKHLEEQSVKGGADLCSVHTKHPNPSSVDESLQGGEAEHRHKVVAGVAEEVEAVSPGGGLAGEGTEHLLDLLLPGVPSLAAEELLKQGLQGTKVGG